MPSPCSSFVKVRLGGICRRPVRQGEDRGYMPSPSSSRLGSGVYAVAQFVMVRLGVYAIALFVKVRLGG